MTFKEEQKLSKEDLKKLVTGGKKVFTEQGQRNWGRAGGEMVLM